MLKLFLKQKKTFANYKQPKSTSSQKYFLKISYVVLMVSLLLWGWQILHNPQTLPIESVQIKGIHNFIKPQQLKQTMEPYLHAGFFSINTSQIQSSLLALPWIAEVSIKRIWPHSLVVNIKEQEPLAEWIPLDSKPALVNAKGQLFFPEPLTFPEGLPILVGPTPQKNQLLSLFQQYNLMLSAINLTIDKLQMSPRESIQLTLSNNIVMFLGKQNMLLRLQRFIDIYSKVFLHKTNLVEYVDMRYTNGMSVKWKKI